uniref:limulus clotting factor C n=1 Tax=Ectomocoris sp. TaxID=3104572 RepID=A0AB38ZE91_9HEMI
MKLLLILLFAGTALAGDSPIKTSSDLILRKGDTVPIKSPLYPDVPPPGTRVIWYLTGDPDTNLLLTCDDLRISPSPDCDKGYLSVYDGAREEKYCGSENGLTIKSVEYQMKIIFDVNWSSGVANCQIKCVDKKEGTKIPHGQNEDGVILVTPEGVASDAVYEPFISTHTNKIWRFETNPGGRIGLHCTQFVLSDDCERSKLILTDGTNKEEICVLHYRFNKTTITNKLTVQLITTNWYGGAIDCLVQAISGDHPLEYRNIMSVEVDSSEYGRQSGLKRTNCNCGWSNKSPGRVVNGQEVSLGQYPWIVSLNFNGGHMCGGSIITEYHVLTAAHCVHDRRAENLRVFVGTVNNTNADRGQIIQVKKIVLHNYIRQMFHQDDIAVLILEEGIKFNNHIGPVCLPTKRIPLNNKMITVMGWGALGNEGGWINPQQLMRAHMRVVEHTTCSYLWYRKFDTEQPDRICTWASNRDSCYGDSGGPLVWLDPETNRYTQIGLVSFGRGCNTDYPKVNSNVAHYYNWIQQVISSTKPEMKTCSKID